MENLNCENTIKFAFVPELLIEFKILTKKKKNSIKIISGGGWDYSPCCRRAPITCPCLVLLF
jgi:hypothetical protein